MPFSIVDIEITWSSLTWLVSVSNDNVTFSNQTTVFVFDSKCLVCTDDAPACQQKVIFIASVWEIRIWNWIDSSIQLRFYNNTTTNTVYTVAVKSIKVSQICCQLLASFAIGKEIIVLPTYVTIPKSPNVVNLCQTVSPFEVTQGRRKIPTDPSGTYDFRRVIHIIHRVVCETDDDFFRRKS